MPGRMKIRRAKFTIEVRGMRKLDFWFVSIYISKGEGSEGLTSPKDQLNRLDASWNSSCTESLSNLLTKNVKASTQRSGDLNTNLDSSMRSRIPERLLEKDAGASSSSSSCSAADGGKSRSCSP